jgi:hypothetical protein
MGSGGFGVAATVFFGSAAAGMDAEDDVIATGADAPGEIVVVRVALGEAR